MSRKKKVPAFARCAGCGHNLEIAKYQFGFPADDVAPERITWGVVPQGSQTYQLLCTCGHYTIAAPFARKAAGQ